MRKVCLIITSLSLLFLGYPTKIARAATVREPLLIIELQTGSAESGTHEYVKFYNPNEESININGWALQYRTAKYLDSESGWTTKAEYSCLTEECPLSIPSKSTITVASGGYLPTGLTDKDIVRPKGNTAEKPKSLSFSSTGGQIRVISWTAPDKPTKCDSACNIEDLVVYGDIGSPAPAPDGDEILKRTTDPQNDKLYIDTDNSQSDFSLAQTTSQNPPIDNIYTPEPTAEDEIEAEDTDDGPVKAYATNLTITELLPDPKAPQLDSQDEYIELFNPNNYQINLEGYIIEAGTNWRYKYTLPNITIGPLEYLAIKSASSKLSLSNSGTGVRLLSPDSTTIYEVSNYGKAIAGYAWVNHQGRWQWTTTPTPNAANIVKAPPAKSKSSATKNSAATASKSGQTKAASVKDSANEASNNQPNNNGFSINYWLIGCLVALAGGYAVYEYRDNIFRGFRAIKDRLSSRK